MNSSSGLLAPPTFNRPLHWLAILTTLSTFPLIFIGGLVTSHHAGMSVPDWPTSFGYNMFALPWSHWTRAGGVIYEHSHRLLGSAVGLLAILLTVLAWWTERRRWVKWLATAVLGTVIFQGVLGGLRVVYNELDLAVVHACLAQAFFCLAALVAIVTSRGWLQAPDLSDAPEAHGHRLIRVAVIACVLVYLQLILGALMRHYNAGLAIPDFPWNYGQLVPPLNQDELRQVNRMREVLWNLDPVEDLGRIWLHFAHRLGALIVTLVLVNLAVRIFRDRARRWLMIPTVLLLALLLAQLTLGILTVLLGKPADIATLHVAVGALVLLTTFLLAVRLMRLYSPLSRHRLAGGEVKSGPSASIFPRPASA